MYYAVTSYLKFLLASTNQHGVHSPFVFELATNCFYDKASYPEYETLRSFRRALEKDQNVIEVTDFGAGSRVFTSNKRKVSRIAKNAGISKTRQRLLFRLTRYFKPEYILELGTSLGMASAAMALGNPEGHIVSIEGCPNTHKRAHEALKELDHPGIRLINSSFEDFFSSLDLATFKLIYVDGNHSKMATLQYFEKLLQYVDNDSVLIFDDIYWSKDMTDAWSEIVAHPKVTVSIDTFQWGMVFFRKEQQKEHFRIRL